MISNAKSQATDAALSRQVACTDGLAGWLNEEKNVKHELKREHAGKHEMGSITPTCSCGWRGRTEYAYNDYQHTNVKEQEGDHMRAAVRGELKTANDLGNRRDAGPIGGASVLTDGLCGNGNYNERTDK